MRKKQSQKHAIMDILRRNRLPNENQIFKLGMSKKKTDVLFVVAPVRV